MATLTRSDRHGASLTSVIIQPPDVDEALLFAAELGQVLDHLRRQRLPGPAHIQVLGAGAGSRTGSGGGVKITYRSRRRGRGTVESELRSAPMGGGQPAGPYITTAPISCDHFHPVNNQRSAGESPSSISRVAAQAADLPLQRDTVPSPSPAARPRMLTSSVFFFFPSAVATRGVASALVADRSLGSSLASSLAFPFSPADDVARGGVGSQWARGFGGTSGDGYLRSRAVIR